MDRVGGIGPSLRWRQLDDWRGPSILPGPGLRSPIESVAMPKLPVVSSRLLLLAVLAFFGLLLVYLPSTLVEQYRAAKELGRVWGALYLATVGTGGVLLAGVSGWILWQVMANTRRKRQRQRRTARNPSGMSVSERERELADNLTSVSDLRNDPSVSDDLRRELTPLIQWIEEKQEQRRLEIVAFGTISSGKSSLLNALAGRDVFATDLRGGTTVERNEIPWPGMDEVRLVDTPGLAEIDASHRQHAAAEAAKDADIVLVVVDGPLRDSEFQLLEKLAEMEKRVVICLNKEDWYTPKDRDALLGQIARQSSPFVMAGDIVAVRSRPTQRERVRILPDGQEIPETVEVPPDIQPLAERMLQIVRHDGRDLLAANLLLQSRGLVDEAKERVRGALDRRAWEIVEKYTWGSAGAAALSPLPLVDLAASAVISTKMVMDLARVYHQDIDVDVAVNLLGQQGKNLLGVLGTTAATPMITATIASLIKGVPGVGTLAGGMLQGVVQAVITRWIGGIFIRYFKDEMRTPPGGLAALARKEWERVTSVTELRKLVQSARRQYQEHTPLVPESKEDA
jgi:small GTP-binding protein